MSVSGGSVLAALLLSLIASMLIGLSLLITATYIMTVVMVAPALVKLGIPEHVAHLLVFYFAVLSEVSPPVGLSPCAAAAVTGGNPFGSMMQAWKYSLPAFLVPFFSTTAVGYGLPDRGGQARFSPGLCDGVCSCFSSLWASSDTCARKFRRRAGASDLAALAMVIPHRMVHPGLAAPSPAA
jgi:hypothetical protein